MRRSAVLVFALALVLSACTSSATVHTPPAMPTLPGPPATPTCTPPTSILSDSIGLEAQGHVTANTGSGAGTTATETPSLWALLQPSVWPLRADTLVKIVWRMTGDGGLSLVAVGPDGSHLAPQDGPRTHSGSNWDRPGDEWGSLFVFPVAGCWDLHASRADIAGDIQLLVGAAYTCPAPSTAPSVLGGHEVEGTAPASSSSSGSSGPTPVQPWALVTSDAWPPRAGTSVTIDVRMTGTGVLVIKALGPGGTTFLPAAPSDYPTPHSTSAWTRPGDEYRAVLTFPSAGCWDVMVYRSDTIGDVPLTVVI